jgi:hypothetical protein
LKLRWLSARQSNWLQTVSLGQNIKLIELNLSLKDSPVCEVIPIQSEDAAEASGVPTLNTDIPNTTAPHEVDAAPAFASSVEMALDGE